MPLGWTGSEQWLLESDNCFHVSFLLKGGFPMKKFVNSIVEFVRNEDGPTAVEYAVMLALIIVVCITAITAIGTNANATFGEVGNTLASTAGQSGN
jgi:pilus assembly protein Flp/PilA